MTKEIGLYYGSSTCYTEIVAEKIIEILGADRVDLHNIATADFDSFNHYDFLIFGIPTWDYGELQEDWDDRWDELNNVDLQGRTCAIFGLGDQQGYPDWFQDAIGYLYYKLKLINGNPIGLWPNEGYVFNQSKALTEDKQHFLGLALDNETQSELTDKRIQTWLTDINLLS